MLLLLSFISYSYFFISTVINIYLLLSSYFLSIFYTFWHKELSSSSSQEFVVSLMYLTFWIVTRFVFRIWLNHYIHTVILSWYESFKAAVSESWVKIFNKYNFLAPPFPSLLPLKPLPQSRLCAQTQASNHGNWKGSGKFKCSP